MTDIDIIYQRLFIGVFVAFVLMGVYSYFDHGRTLECRTQAVSKGLSAADAISTCKR